MSALATVRLQWLFLFSFRDPKLLQNVPILHCHNSRLWPVLLLALVVIEVKAQPFEALRITINGTVTGTCSPCTDQGVFAFR